MIVHQQKPIEFVNTCGAIVDYKLLEKAMLALTTKPIARLKKIFLHGKYPAISIHDKKIHIHRLLKCYQLNRKFLWADEYVHHKNENKFDARLSNLELITPFAHQSHHNNGKKVSLETRRKLTEANKRNWATKWRHRRIFENPDLLTPGSKGDN